MRAPPPWPSLSALCRRLAIAALAVLASGSGAAADPLEIRASAVPLNPRDTSDRTAGRLEYLGGFELAASDPRWGGFSSMVLTADGEALLAVSDFGNWLRLRLHHDRDGRLTGVGAAEIGFLPGLDGKPLGDKASADAEALAMTADGAVLVAFERTPRIWRYGGAADQGEGPPFALPPESVPLPDGADRLPGNAGIEALVVLPDGDILAIAEGKSRGTADMAGWLRREADWQPLSWIRTRPYRPTDAHLLPNGDVLVLERRYSLSRGAGARLSVVPAEAIAAGARLAGTVLAELAPPRSVDNFEGVAARAAPGGGVLIYLLSDDNGSILQRTLLLQFRWRP